MPEQKGRYIIDFHDIPSKRHGMPELEAKSRASNFDEVELGLSLEDAQAEAKRCLSCRRCLGCELCLAACANRAIVFQQDDEVIDLVMDEVIIPDDVGCEMAVKKGELGYGVCKNVITAFEFESMLSKTGPYGGMLMRPYDGELPQKIAFIINVGNDAKQADTLLSYVIEEASLAKKNIKDLAITLFSPDTLSETPAPGAILKRATVTEVIEESDTQNLIVKFAENDAGRDEVFDMVVIAKMPEISTEIQELRERLG